MSLERRRDVPVNKLIDSFSCTLDRRCDVRLRHQLLLRHTCTKYDTAYIDPAVPQGIAGPSAQLRKVESEKALAPLTPDRTRQAAATPRGPPRRGISSLRAACWAFLALGSSVEAWRDEEKGKAVSGCTFGGRSKGTNRFMRSPEPAVVRCFERPPDMQRKHRWHRCDCPNIVQWVAEPPGMLRQLDDRSARKLHPSATSLWLAAQ